MKNYVYLLVMIMAISACNNTKKNQKKLQNYPVIRALLTDTSITDEFVADINAIQNVEIRARVNGFLDEILVDEGQYVHQGQLLFKLSSQEHTHELLKANAQLKSAIAESKIASVELKNTQTLAEQNVISKSELEMAMAKLDAAKAKIEEAESAVYSAQLKLSFASIRAPFSGIINRLPLKEGSLVSEGSLLTTLSNDKEVFAYFNLSEKQYLYYTKNKNNGQSRKVRLTLADGYEFPSEGIIETSESEFDKNTGNLAMRARFKNAEKILKHGASAKIRLMSHIKDALLIPQKSTFEIQENLYVFVVDSSNTIQSRNLSIAHRINHLYVVESGILPSDRIVYEGIQTLSDGDKIKPEALDIRRIIKALNQQ